jgi:hypothetical protein
LTLNATSESASVESVVADGRSSTVVAAPPFADTSEMAVFPPDSMRSPTRSAVCPWIFASTAESLSGIEKVSRTASALIFRRPISRDGTKSAATGATAESTTPTVSTS